MKAFFGYTLWALIISVVTLFLCDRPNDKEKLISNLQSQILDVFHGNVDTDTQLMYLESVSRALNTNSCTSNDLGIFSDRKWVSDLRVLVNYRRAVGKRDYLTTQALLVSSGRDDDEVKLKQAREFIRRFNENLWRHSYEPVLMSYESAGDILMAMSDEGVCVVSIPGESWVRK